MSLTLSDLVERLRGLDLERALGLRPAWPQVALALDGRELSMVRLKPRRRATPLLEGHQLRELDEDGVPATLFDQNGAPGDTLGSQLRSAFEALGVRPGRVSLVLPDNLAKISLLQLPERPPNRRQLLEVIRFKMHRAVPFRFSEAAMSFQVIPSQEAGLTVLVALMRRNMVERYEGILEAIGATTGLIDLCTPNLLNLCRHRVDNASTDGDVALLNCTANYFSLIIVRRGRLIFFRCKNYRFGDGKAGRLQEILTREVASSFSYYREKLSGDRVGTMLVRSVSTPFEELRDGLAASDLDRVEPIDPIEQLALPEGSSIASETGLRLAPALGAAMGRG